MRYRREPAEPSEEEEGEEEKVSWALVSFATSATALSVVNDRESELLRGVSKRPLQLKMLDLDKAMTSSGSMREVARAHAMRLREYDMWADGDADHGSGVGAATDAVAGHSSRAHMRAAGAVALGFGRGRSSKAATEGSPNDGPGVAKLATRVAEIARRVDENERVAAQHRARVEAALDALLRDREK